MNSAELAVDAAVCNVLRAASEPLAATKIQKALPKKSKTSTEAVEHALEALVEQGLAFCFAPYRGKGRRFWDRSQEEYARQVIRRAVEQKSRTATDLDKAVQKPLADLSATQRREIVEQLAREGVFYQLPPVTGKTVRYSASPPDPADYLRAAMGRFLKAEAKVRQQLAPLGLSALAVREAAIRLLTDESREVGADQVASVVAPKGGTMAAATSHWDEETPPQNADRQEREAVLARIRDLARDPRLGGFVSLSDVRRAVSGQLGDKERFDRVVCGLAQQQLVDLYPHDYPGSLPPEERDRLVTNGQGTFYNGVSLRLP